MAECKVTLPSPGERYDRANEAATRHAIQTAFLRCPGGTEGGAGAARRTVIWATASLANNAIELGQTDFGAPGQHLLMIETDVPARVRLYSAEAVRDDDEDRPTSTAPDSGIGVFLDAVWNTTHVKYIAPPVFLYNADSPVEEIIYYAVTNLSGSTTPVTVTCTVISAEVGPLGLNPVDDSTVDGEVVNMTGATDGQVLVRVGGVWVPQTVVTDDTTVDGEDFDMTGAADGKYIRRQSGVWVPVDIADDTIDGESVDLTGAANGEFLQRVAGVWVSNPVPDDTLDGDDVDTSGKANGDVLTWNSGTSAWEAAAPTGGGGGIGVDEPIFGGDAQPTSPNAMDDEFEAGSLDAKWNNRNTAVLAFDAGKSRISIGGAQGAADNWRYIAQTAPSAPWKVRVKLIGVAALVNFRSLGLLVAKGTTTDKLMSIAIGSGTTNAVAVNRWTNWTTFSANVGTTLTSADVGTMGDGAILEIENDSTNLIFRWASVQNGGVKMRQIHSETIAAFMGSIAEIGIGIDNNNNTNGDIYAIVDWFRRIS
jgi:hypothetical protein